MSERKSWMLAMVIMAFCAESAVVDRAQCEELLVKKVPYVVQKGHLD